MRRKLLTPALALAAGLLTGAAFAGGENWTDDFAAAQESAATDGKDLLLDFTGSDWCGWCIRLNEEVFAHDAFNDYADENFVLVELDFPRQAPISDETRAQNQALQERFQIRGFPTIILTDAEGLPYAQTGYQAGGPEAYVAHLEELKAVREVRDEHFASAADAQGAEKAQHLHAALQAMGDELALTHYEATIDEIMEIDSENEAGLKGHYEELYNEIDQQEALQDVLHSAGRDADAALAALVTFLENEALVASVRQEATAIKGQILLHQENNAAARIALEQAIEADPESEMAGHIRGMLQQIPAEGE